MSSVARFTERSRKSSRNTTVVQIVVICPPDKERGEEICAVVVPAVATGDVPSDAKEPTAWARERLGRDKYPRCIEVLPSLPVGSSHKVLKRELREELVSAGGDHIVSVAGPVRRSSKRPSSEPPEAHGEIVARACGAPAPTPSHDADVVPRGADADVPLIRCDEQRAASDAKSSCCAPSAKAWTSSTKAWASPAASSSPPCTRWDGEP
ncbi:AMP-binding enzyme [Streptomyces tendae]|uniref:AMP-binding enzyme n=1 Tax=Streptomyces tendae TaxID=1932 RepID=UPI0037160B8D